MKTQSPPPLLVRDLWTSRKWHRYTVYDAQESPEMIQVILGYVCKLWCPGKDRWYYSPVRDRRTLFPSVSTMAEAVAGLQAEATRPRK